MKRALAWASLLVLAAVAAGCGNTVDVREANLSVRPATTSPTGPTTPATPPGTPTTGRIRIAVVTHGQASDPFWTIVRNGINQAAHQMNVSVSYAAPDTYDLARMRVLIEQAVARRPDGLVVSIPDARVLGPAIRSAERAGIPVVSINSGTPVANSLGVLVHIGQQDRNAGLEAGQRFARSGVRRALCVNQEKGNSALQQRCEGFAAAMKHAHGSSSVVTVTVQDRPGAERAISAAIQSRRVDGIMALGPTSAAPALDALRSNNLLGRVKLATFDLSADVISAVRRGQIEFAVDQQPFLQGYLPIVLLAQYKRYGVLPDRGRVVDTGPSFVTQQVAATVQTLADQQIR
jgi:simple sugar transport system substrate-binding protein